MSTERRLLLASFTLAAASTFGGCATAPPPAPAMTPAGAPTSFAEQMSNGQKLYAEHCASCHGDSGEGGTKAPPVVGIANGALPLDPPSDRQLRKSRFETVADVANFVVANMPPKKAGSLTNDQYWAILAFDLHANGIDLPSPLTPEMAPTLKIPR
jgi:cytochrome c